MPKLNQIIAVVAGKKSWAQSELTQVYHRLQKDALYSGLERTYKPKDEDGDKLPPESQKLQRRVSEELETAAKVLTELFDAVATQDYGNCVAKADVAVDGKVILPQVPVTYLLFLEKQLTDIHSLVEKLPTLDPSEEWAYSEGTDSYATKPTETTRTKKVPKSMVMYEATDKHPAQVQVYNEDVLIGYWSLVKFSGAISAKEKNELREKVRKLQDAVKSAREEANGVQVEQVKVGEAVFGYLFG